MGSEFNINAVNPLSPQILAAWNANAAAYNATNPKYPYPAAPSAIYGVEADGNAPAGSDPQGEFHGKNILIQRLAIADAAR